MEETYSLGLSLLDFLPVLAFLIGAIFLVKLADRECGRACAAIMSVGTGLVFVGGLLKAVWKLLFTIGAGDIVLLSEQQFVLLAPGFLLMLISAIQLVRSGRPRSEAALAGMAAWKIPLMAVMTISSVGAYGILSYMGFRRRRPLAGVLFILTIILTLGMAGMAGGEQSVSRQWAEESINSLSQISMAVGSYLLYRASQAATPRAGGKA